MTLLHFGCHSCIIAAMERLPELVPSAPLASRAWFSASISEFLQTRPDAIVGRLARNGGFSLLSTQTDARLAQIALLQERLVALNGAVFLEFNIPRMGRRIDAVLLIGPVVFVVEFKVGESVFERAAVDHRGLCFGFKEFSRGEPHSLHCSNSHRD